jgi:tetratricopeptide (TPR) repeat protein
MLVNWEQIVAQFSQLVQAEDWPGAETLLRGVAGRKDTPPAVHYNLGKVLMKLKKHEESGTWFQRAVADDPNYPPTWFEIGRWHASRREFAEARDAFQRAGALMPNDPDCRRLAGRAALALGDWGAAMAAYRELRQLIPGDEEGLIKGFKAACEMRSPEAETLRAKIESKPNLRGTYLNTIIRVSAGRLPLRPMAR